VSEYKYLFSPLKIGSVVIPNRLHFAPHMTNYAENNLISERHIYYYQERAKGGCGLITTEEMGIHPTDHPYDKLVDAYEPETIPGFLKLTRAIHEYDAKIFAQLNHNGMQGDSKLSRLPVWGPSAGKDPIFRETCKEMEIEDIQECIEYFAKSALNAVEGGFDGIEVQLGHSSLVRQFLSPLTNHREDEYGGSFENRMRFALEVMNAMRKAVGPGYTLGVRLNADEMHPRGGLTHEDAKKIAVRFEQTGQIDFMDLSLGTFYNLYLVEGSMHTPLAYTAPLAAGIRSVISLPVFCTNRINDPHLAEKILEDGQADMIGMVRALICDPELPNKAAEGKEEEIRHCIYCNNGCIDRLWAGLDCTCTMNPAVGMEEVFDKKLCEPVSKKKKVLVIGGGPGGMSCARYAKLRGHDVILCEKEEELGGLVRYSQKGEGRGEWEEVTHYYSREIKKLGVDIRLGEAIDLEKVKSISPDAVVVAIGSTPKIPIIKGIRKANGQLADNVVTVLDVLGDKKEIGNSVVIVGGTHFGIQAAFYLLGQGKKVTIIETLQELNQDLDGALAWNGFLMPKLKISEIEVLLGTYVQEILPEGVLCGPSGMAPYASDVGALIGTDAETIIPCDTVVVGAGREPLKNLYQELRGVVPEIYEIGDCVKPRWTYSATGEGARVGINL